MNSPFAPISPSNVKTGLTAINPSQVFMAPDADKKDGSFSNVFLSFMNSVNDAQLNAGRFTKDLVAGKLENTHEMSIAGAKSEVMLHLATQIASKLSTATTQLFQMQI